MHLAWHESYASLVRRKRQNVSYNKFSTLDSSFSAESTRIAVTERSFQGAVRSLPNDLYHLLVHVGKILESAECRGFFDASAEAELGLIFARISQNAKEAFKFNE